MTRAAPQVPDPAADPAAPATPRGRRHARRAFMARIALGLVVLAVMVAAVARAHSALHAFASAFGSFRVGRLPWLSLAVGAEVASFACYALVQRRLLRAGGLVLTRRTMFGLAVAATGITNLVPGGTAPASGWLVGQYRRRDVPVPLALWVVLAGGFAAAVSILLLLLVGAGVAGLLSPWETVGCGALGALVAAAVVISTHHVAAIDAWLDARRHRGLGALRRAVHSVAAVTRFRLSVPTGATVLALSVANWGLDVWCLVASFAVLGRPVPWHAVLFAYAVAQVAGSLAPVPGGIGFVEGGMVGAFALVGTPAGDALAATVVYRAITCWAVAAVGSLALMVLSRRPARGAVVVNAEGQAPGSAPAPAPPCPDEARHGATVTTAVRTRGRGEGRA